MSAPLTSEQVNYLIWRYLQESGFERSTFSFQDDCRAQLLEEKFGQWVTPGALINIIQRGLQYLALEASIRENGSNGSNKVFSFFGPANPKETEQKHLPVSKEVSMDDASADVVMAGTPPPHQEGNGVSVELEAQKAELLREPPQSNGTVTPVKRSHDISTATAMELNGVLSQRTKRAKTGAADENAMVIDGIGLPDTTSEEVRATIGSSVGVQADELIQLDSESTGVYLLSPQDGSLDTSAKGCKFSPAENNTLVVALENCHLFNLDSNLFTPDRKIQDTDLYQQYGEEMSAVEWSADGEVLATASWDGLIKVWDSKGQQRQSLKMHRAPILRLKFHPTRHGSLLSVDGHSKVSVWDTDTGKIRGLCELSDVDASGMRSTPHDADWIDDSTIVIVGDNGSVEKFDLSQQSDKGVQLESVMRYEGHDTHKHVNCVIWSVGHDVFATGGEEGKILLWKPTQSKPVGVLSGHQSNISSFELSRGTTSSESLLGSSSADGTVRIWNVENRICLHICNMQSPADTMSFTNDGKFLAAGAQNLMVMIWHTETGQLAGMYDAKQGEEVSPERTLEDLSWDKEGSKLAVAVKDQKCAIINWATLLNEAATKKAR